MPSNSSVQPLRGKRGSLGGMGKPSGERPKLRLSAPNFRRTGRPAGWFGFRTPSRALPSVSDRQIARTGFLVVFLRVNRATARRAKIPRGNKLLI
jgi:hypothetical protein